jgi:hypothetical protein
MEIDEYFRVEITEDGEIEVVIGMELLDSDDDELPWVEVIGLSLTSSPETKSAQTICLEVIEEEDEEGL